jgi:hypothetical protein
LVPLAIIVDDMDMRVCMSGSLVGDGDVPALRAGDRFEAGLELNDPQRIDVSETTVIGVHRPVDGMQDATYEVVGVARSSGLTWVLDVGDVRIAVYEEGQQPPSVGQRIALRGRLCIAGDHVWYLATDPRQGGTAAYDGRRRWKVDQIEVESPRPDDLAMLDADGSGSSRAIAETPDHPRDYDPLLFYVLDITPC